MQLKGISKTFKTPVIRDLSVSFSRGLHIITGPNACGKTTLLKIISGYILPDEGYVSVPPENVCGLFSNFCFYPQLTVIENLEFFLALRGKLSKSCIEDAVRMSRINYSDLNKKIEVLSSGNLVKAGLSRIYAYDADVFVIDEVLSSLDEESFNATLEILKDKSKEKIIIIVSHQKDRYNIKDAVLWKMVDGKIFK